VIKRGYLKKQNNDGFVRSWKPRWFVLRNDVLCYYNNEADEKGPSDQMLQMIPILASTRVQPHPQKTDTFIFQATDRNYVLQAEGTNERDVWVQAIG